MCGHSRGSAALRTIPETNSQPFRERVPSEDTLVERASSEVTLLDRKNMADVNGTSELEKLWHWRRWQYPYEAPAGNASGGLADSLQVVKQNLEPR